MNILHPLFIVFCFSRENGISTTSEVTVLGLPCEYIPISLSMTAPAHGFVRTPMLLKYHIHNKTTNLIQLDVLMEAREAFMFSGYKQVYFIVAPQYREVKL